MEGFSSVSGIMNVLHAYLNTEVYHSQRLEHRFILQEKQIADRFAESIRNYRPFNLHPDYLPRTFLPSSPKKFHIQNNQTIFRILDNPTS